MADNTQNLGASSLSSEPLSKEQTQDQASKDLAHIRSIINAQAFSAEQKRQTEQAREYVTQVVTEALNDRQQKDSSVSKILIPIVEESVQKSIRQNRSQFIDSLYPLVGDLVRKFTTAFLRDFIEKTNELIEKSVTLKSVGWRFKAWRSGMNYATYVASQTYVFQIQQVLLIHHETGLLLNSVNVHGQEDENSDIVSSMLTAIDDFVNDSFSAQSESEHLDEIKTRNFTLYLRKGPQAFLVAAVTGNISPEAKNKLQTTLESIHNLYYPQLNEFNGDTSALNGIENELQECLISEEKQPAAKKKKPLLALILMTAILALLAYWAYLNWQTDQAIERVKQLPMNEGIVLTQLEKQGTRSIRILALRDPRALSVEEWLATADVPMAWIQYSEVAFVSLANTILVRELSAIAQGFDGVKYDTSNNTFSGEVNSLTYVDLQNAVSQLPGSSSIPIHFEVTIKDTPQDIEETKQAAQQALNIIAGDIAQLQFTFPLASSDLSPNHNAKAKQIADKFKQLKAYAEQVGLKPTLLVLGTSDQIGDIIVNQRLSVERAQNAKAILLSQGLQEQDLLVSALGVVVSGDTKINIRKAIISVVFNPK